MVKVLSRPVARSVVVVVAGFITAVALLSTGALAGNSTAQPNATLGQKQFKSAGCGACHRFAAAASTGKIGPDLDAPNLSLQQLTKQITLGGCTVMGTAAKKQYPFPMSAFKGKLSAAEIAHIAAFVFVSRNPNKVAKGASIPVTYGSGGGSTGKSSGGTTTTSAGGGGGSTPVGDGCPAGTTIQTSGVTDNDGDDGGGPTDNDGCV